MSKNIEKQYLKLLKDILDNGTHKQTRNGETLSVFGRQIRHDMSKGFPLLTTKKMAWKQIVTELLWFLRGDTNIKFLVNNDCHIWDGDAFKNYLNTYKGNFEMDKDEFVEAIKTNPEFAKKWGNLGPVYGRQWRHWTVSINDELDPNRKIPGGYRYSNGEYTETYIDQIANLINDLKTNPDSRRLMVTAWNPAELDKMTLPPCHYGFQVWTRELTWEEQVQWVLKNTDVEMENLYIVEEIAKESTPKRAISLMWNQRSVDSFLGLPFNIASYGLLLEIIAKEVNMVPDELIGNLGDTHLYLNHIEQAKEQMTREPMILPKLIINNEFWNPDDSMLSIEQVKHMQIDDFTLENYQSHPTIKAPLSN